ncbi:hypothetical protein JCM10296v2_005777 [Rhodotorula toruloides]
MPSAAGAADADCDEEMPPKKRRRGDASDAPSETSTVLANAAEDQMTAAQLLEAYDDPWAYSQKQLEVIEECSSARLALVADEMWVRTSWQVTARWSVDAVSGLGELVERCAVTHQEGRGVKFIDLLRQAQVVPERAHVNSQANRLHLAYEIHRDIDDRLPDLFPHQGQVIARLASEIKYQEQRIGADAEAIVTLPARPPFELFYAAAEKEGAWCRLIASNRKDVPVIVRYDQHRFPTVFALEGIAPDDALRLILGGAKNPPPNTPILPALVAPVSMNLLIWATSDRLRRSPPSPSSLRQEYSTTAQLVDLLHEFWFLNDKTPIAAIADLVGRARVLVQEHGGPEWVHELSRLGTVAYADIVKAERALMLEAAAAATYSDDEDDLPALDFPEPHLPPQLGIVPSHPLTTAALKELEMQQLRDSGKSTSAPSSGEKSSTPSLSPPASSPVSTCTPSLPAPVHDADAVRAYPGKLSLISSFMAGGFYPFEATGAHPV